MQNKNLTAITISIATALCKEHSSLSESSDFDTIGSVLYQHNRPVYNYFINTDDYDLIGETVFALYFNNTDATQFETND